MVWEIYYDTALGPYPSEGPKRRYFWIASLTGEQKAFLRIIY